MHGGGCTFSASLTAYVAKNYAIVDACRSANQFTHSSLKNRIVIGSKFIINSPFFKFYELADRYEVYTSLQRAIEMIEATPDRKSTRLNSSHMSISYAVFCLKKKKKKYIKNK